MKKLFSYIIITLNLIVFNSCIDDKITPPFIGELNPTAEMLTYFEAQGDFANTIEAPALVNAEEVFADISSYLIIDIRNETDFINGHIEGAVNVLTDSLLEFISNAELSSFNKIVIVSKNGQSSAFFTCLLRLADFSNVYSMKYGMASWHQDFADEWLNALNDHISIFDFTNEIYPKNNFSDLPEIVFDNPGASLKRRIEERVKKIINEGFQYFSVLPSANINYLVCYGSGRLYFSSRSSLVFPELGHPPGTVSYNDSPLFELRSVNYLQTLPTNESIAMYDYDGQLSACMTAYLRVLGYDAKPILFGAHQLFYSRMAADPELIAYAFKPADIQNYPYITGK
jgi:rhodanese-related sulfurtransferase